MAQRLSQKIWESRNYQMTSHFFPTVFMAATLQFKRHPSSSFNSSFWVYFDVKQSSNYEFVKKPVKSERMLDAVTTNEPAEHREGLPSAHGQVL